MGKYDPTAEKGAAYVHELNRERVRTPAECAEGVDDARSADVDRWAEKFRARGLEARTALGCAELVVADLAARDRAVLGDEPEWGADEQARLLEGLRDIAVKIYQAPKRGVAAGALILATGATHGDFESARELAVAQEVSHELAANWQEDWQRFLGLGRTILQKTDEAKKTYANTNGRTAK